MIVQSFSSGSSGNAAIVRSGGTAILVDCGLGPRALKKALAAHGVDFDALAAVVVTHEHIDHVRGLRALLARATPIHATAGTGTSAEIPRVRGERLASGDELRVGAISVTVIPTSHDAAEPCGFSFSDGTNRATLLTDLGETDPGCLDLLGASDLIVIEANHDVQMLKNGPYPVHLKQRVLSRVGHLSNADCGSFLAVALSEARRPRTDWLGHLSATNNRPELAVRTVQRALVGLPQRHSVVALPRLQCGPIWSPGARPAVEQLSLFAD